VVAKVEWHTSELCPRIGLDPHCGSSVTTLSRLSCSKFCNNKVRLQLPALAHGLGYFMGTLALSKLGGAPVVYHAAGNAGEDQGQRCVWMTIISAKWASDNGQIIKSGLPNDRGANFLPSAVGFAYDLLRIGGQLGNIGWITAH
jgi:hypothetical protein